MPRRHAKAIDNDAMLADYSRCRDRYVTLGEKLQPLILHLLSNERVRCHSVTHRVKSAESLSDKLSRHGRPHRKLTDVTDLLGIRIIVFLPSEAARLEMLVRREFSIVPEPHRSATSRQQPDRFGYASRHLLIRLSPARAGLREYSDCAGLTAEVQIRTVLQHAWAEIEHDLVYKTSSALPAEIRRRFSRLASLMELADSEFESACDDIIQHRARLPQVLVSPLDSVPIDTFTLAAYIGQNPLVADLDSLIARTSRSELAGLTTDWVDSLVRDLRYLSVESIGRLHRLLVRHRGPLKRFSILWISSQRHWRLTRGICVAYLGYFLVGLDGNLQAVTKYLRHFAIGHASERAQLAGEIIRLVKRCRRSGGRTAAV